MAVNGYAAAQDVADLKVATAALATAMGTRVNENEALTEALQTTVDTVPGQLEALENSIAPTAVAAAEAELAVKAERDGSNLTGGEPAAFRAAIAAVSSAAIQAAAGGLLVGFQDTASGSPLSTLDAYLRSLAANAKMLGATGDGTTDDTVALNRAFASGRPVYIPSGTYKTTGLTISTADIVIFSDGYVSIDKIGNGDLLTITANSVTLRGIGFRGDGFTGHGIVCTADNLTLIDCAARGMAGRCVKAEGNRTVVRGTKGGWIWQTTDASATGYEFEIGKSGTATLYHRFDDIYTSQATGGFLFIDCGSNQVFGGLYGKITIQPGTSPAGVNGGLYIGGRCLGDVTVGVSGAEFGLMQFGPIIFTIGSGTSGLKYAGNAEQSGFTLVNNGTVNQDLLRHYAAGTGGRISYQYGPSSSLAILEVDPASGTFYLPADVYMSTGKGMRFANSAGAITMRIRASGDNLELVTAGSLQYTAAQHQLVVGGVVPFTVDSAGGKLLAGCALYNAGMKVVGARDTGWTADTGTAKKTANATFTPGYTSVTISAVPTQAEVQAINDALVLTQAALRDATQLNKALKDALITHGLIGT